MNVIRDKELCSSIGDYYFDTSRFGSTTDDRVELQWVDIRSVLARFGLSTIGGGADLEILEAFRNNPEAVAELKNVRDYAVMRMSAHDITIRSFEALIQMLDLAN